MLIKQVNQKSVTFAIIHYWYFSDKRFNFQPHVCIGCHDVLIMFMNLNNIAIFNINGVTCRCISGVSKSEATKVMQNIDLTEKGETL